MWLNHGRNTRSAVQLFIYDLKLATITSYDDDKSHDDANTDSSGRDLVEIVLLCRG